MGVDAIDFMRMRICVNYLHHVIPSIAVFVIVRADAPVYLCLVKMTSIFQRVMGSGGGKGDVGKPYYFCSSVLHCPRYLLRIRVRQASLCMNRACPSAVFPVFLAMRGSGSSN